MENIPFSLQLDLDEDDVFDKSILREIQKSDIQPKIDTSFDENVVQQFITNNPQKIIIADRLQSTSSAIHNLKEEIIHREAPCDSQSDMISDRTTTRPSVSNKEFDEDVENEEDLLDEILNSDLSTPNTKEKTNQIESDPEDLEDWLDSVM